jgi:hypothetical protein
MTDEPRSSMTAKERDVLCNTVRLNARVAKADVDKRAAALRAQAEQQLSAVFKADDEAWCDLTDAANAAAEAADRELATRCDALGIRQEFRPKITAGWIPRGENAFGPRRTELRMLAIARIDAAAKDAKHSIERWQAETQTRLLSGLLQSEEAREFLASMPSADSLLSPITMRELDALSTTKPLRLVVAAGCTSGDRPQQGAAR